MGLDAAGSLCLHQFEALQRLKQENSLSDAQYLTLFEAALKGFSDYIMMWWRLTMISSDVLFFQGIPIPPKPRMELQGTVTVTLWTWSRQDGAAYIVLPITAITLVTIFLSMVSILRRRRINTDIMPQYFDPSSPFDLLLIASSGALPAGKIRMFKGDGEQAARLKDGWGMTQVAFGSLPGERAGLRAVQQENEELQPMITEDGLQKCV